MNTSSSSSSTKAGAAAQRNPGDEAAPGTPQTGEAICPVCNGSGSKGGTEKCDNCGGTGRIVQIVGDA